MLKFFFILSILFLLINNSLLFPQILYSNTLNDWTVITGSLNKNGNFFTAVTEGQTGQFSSGWYEYKIKLPDKFRVSVNVKMTDSEYSDFEIYCPAGVFTFTVNKGGYYFFYQNESNKTNWIKCGYIVVNGINKITVYQDKSLIKAYINGQFAGEFKSKYGIKTDKLSIYIKALPGKKTSVEFSDFQVEFF